MAYFYYLLGALNIALLIGAILFDMMIKGNTRSIYTDLKVIVFIALICSLMLLVFDIPYLKILFIIISAFPPTVFAVSIIMMIAILIRGSNS
jgi:hypothetical protein